MRITMVTTLPEMFHGPLSAGVLGRAVESGTISVDVVNLRDYTSDRHRTTDDYPFGGGAGMVMLPEPIMRAYQEIRGRDPEARFILTTPHGVKFDQHEAMRLSGHESLVFFCGRYEGVDERVRGLFHEELSLGDFILSGGELAAMAMVDAIARLLPGVLGNSESTAEESFSQPLLEYPQYTRPREFDGMAVPDVLLSYMGGKDVIARR